jgi:hypothetical protein
MQKKMAVERNMLFLHPIQMMAFPITTEKFGLNFVTDSIRSVTEQPSKEKHAVVS